jgi:HEAT repeat protein
VFLLDPIAHGTLWQIADGEDTGLRLLALESLARGGSPGARSRLRVLTDSTPAALAALADLGDAPSATALVDGALGGQIRPENAAELLPAAGFAAIDALVSLLKHPVAPVRADAIRGLGRVGARGAIPQLRAALTDPHPLVSSSAVVALTRLGDPEGEERANRMLGSDVPDMRLMAAAAFAARGDSRWTASVTPLLKDPNGLTRLTAAELLAQVEPEAAYGVVAAALCDQNPVVRAAGARVLAAPALAVMVQSDLASLRRLLRDPDESVRLRASALILELVSGRA